MEVEKRADDNAAGNESDACALLHASCFCCFLISFKFRDFVPWKSLVRHC